VWRALEQESVRTCCDRVVHDLVEVERGQEEDPRPGFGRHQGAGSGKAVADGHADVHHDHVRRKV
jgi:hypothetical protein